MAGEQRQSPLENGDRFSSRVSRLACVRSGVRCLLIVLNRHPSLTYTVWLQRHKTTVHTTVFYQRVVLQSNLRNGLSVISGFVRGRSFTH